LKVNDPAMKEGPRIPTPAPLFLDQGGLTLEQRTAKDQAQYQQTQEDEEDHLRNVRSTFSDTGKTEDRSNDGYHKKYGCPLKHVLFVLIDHKQ
jgi:hypothetical protein